jgi:hypothetical protein
MKALDDSEHLEALVAEGRVLLVITPDGPPPPGPPGASVSMWPETNGGALR